MIGDDGEPLKIKAPSNFLERKDLVKINVCYHRYHLYCLYHTWFDSLSDDLDNKGNVIE